jgi:hypothetical protein
LQVYLDALWGRNAEFVGHSHELGERPRLHLRHDLALEVVDSSWCKQQLRVKSVGSGETAFVKAAKDRGIPFVMINTNGKRIARDDRFLEQLNGVRPSIYFQFHGFDAETYRIIRGEPGILKEKLHALDRLASTGLTALAMLGPGLWSIDARLFGWKRIETSPRKTNSNSR